MKLDSVTRWWTWDVPLSSGIFLFVILALAPLFGWALAQERWIIVVVLVMTVLVPVVIRWPVVSTFGLYAFVLPFDGIPLLANAGGTTLTKPIGVIAAAVLAVAGLMERRLGRPPLAALWWGMFVVWGALSAAWAIDPETVLQRLRTTLSLFLLYVVAVSIRPSRKEFYSVCLLAVAGGALAAFIGYVYGFEDAGAMGRGRLVIGEEEGNPHGSSAPLILPLGLAIAGFISLHVAAHKAVALGVAGLIGIGTYVSMSRAVLLAVLVAIAVFFYRTRFKWQIVVAAVALLALTAVMPARLYERVGVLFTGEDTTGSGRTEIWTEGLKALEGFGIVGAGLWNWREAYSIYVGPRGISGGVSGAHNVFLMTWVELGVVGMILMIAALGSHFLAVHRVWKSGGGGVALAAVEAGYWGVLVLTLFSDVIWRKYFWFALILLTWATYCAQRSGSVHQSGPHTRNPVLT